MNIRLVIFIVLFAAFGVLAQPENQEVSVEDKRKAAEFFTKGQAQWKNLDISDAIESFTKALAIYPNYPDALRERGTIYFLISESELAYKDLNSFLKIEPNNSKMLFYRGSASANIAAKLRETETDYKKATDKAQESLADFNKALELNPNDFSIYNGRGKLFLDFDFFKEAIADFEKSAEIYPEGQYSYAYLGYAKFLSKAGSGIGDLGKSIEKDPKFSTAYFLRGNIYRQTGLLKEAIEDYNKAIKLNDFSAEYYNARGMAHYFLKDGDAAAKDFSQAVNLKKDFGMAYFNRGMTYKIFPYSVSNDPNIEPLAKIPIQRKKMMEDFSAAIKYKPNLTEAYIERGLMNSTSMKINLNGPDAETVGQLKLALIDFEQAVKLSPNSAKAYNGRGSCYDQLGKKDLALADYSKAIEFDPQLATAYMGRMAIYCEMGKKELSIADEKRIKELGFAAINICNLGK